MVSVPTTVVGVMPRGFAFAESGAVALAGAALGVLLAVAIVRYVRQTAAVSLPRADEIARDRQSEQGTMWRGPARDRAGPD